ncbi:MAG: hypothetical protein CFE23_05960 [Flavobacterium sp. BFFFF1]|uniref:M56 family metallopeptidase n=1 Tax=Flavobacterium sp. BFFFF1 TaxID=2015557 RepID=UPI000BD5804A|nr:M56 family metallopeptidase [Flavobacterium sp. BFFFF1]OYU81037.1 MAG: hypothetical protein CFE23_05960 [Flavobacterium sp. BFFFF1]
MIDFVVQSGMSMLVLLAVYYAFFEKEKMHHFNRFYLLAALAVSLVLPLITIETVREISLPLNPAPATILLQAQPQQQPTTDYLSLVGYALYGLVTFILTLRFILNLKKFKRLAMSSPSIRHPEATIVLLKEQVPPYTFLNTIFVNQQDYYDPDNDAVLMAHELTHVRQKHSLDILFIEALRTILWFNPMLLLYKKAIQLNHEFLADQRVLSSYKDIPSYQSLLLSKAQGLAAHPLASTLNFSITKKRFLMMTKTTSKARGLAKQMCVLPVLFGLVFFICVDNQAQAKPLTASTRGTSDDQARNRYYAGVQVKIHDYIDNVTIDQPYESMTLEQQRKYLWYVPAPLVEKSPTTAEYQDFRNPKKYAIWIDGVAVKNSALDQYAANSFVFFSGSSVMKNARSAKFPQPFQYSFYTRDYFDKTLKFSHLKYGSSVYTATIYNQNTSKTTKAKATAIALQEGDRYADDTQAEFPGGMVEFIKFFSSNYKIPAGYKGNGKIVASFVITEDGSLKDIKILRETDEKTSAEAIRVLEMSPKWKPGTRGGKPIALPYTIPIVLALDK